MRTEALIVLITFAGVMCAFGLYVSGRRTPDEFERRHSYTRVKFPRFRVIEEERRVAPKPVPFDHCFSAKRTAPRTWIVRPSRRGARRSRQLTDVNLQGPEVHFVARE